MKVAISAKGRFHAFFLANELQKAGLLNQLITSYPVFKAVEYGIGKKYVYSLLLNELVERGTKKLPFKFLKADRANYLFHEYFDKRSAKKIKKNCDIFIGWSSSCLHSIKKLKLKNKAVRIIVENGSTHAVFQKEILEEEYALQGLIFKTDQNIIDKKLEEYALADYISMPSQFTKNSFLQHGIAAQKIICVPYGVDTAKFYPLPKPDNIFRIIFCGNVGLRKGIHYLLQAFYELKLPNAELYIIGPAAAELNPYVAKYKSDNIIWAGCFNENKLVHEYAKGSVFCLPSIEEGLALVIPQAMSCGLPVICTTNTGGADLISEGKEGFILPIRDIEKLKEKILFLYEHPAVRIEMGKQARNTILNNFTWAHYGEKMITQYRNINTKGSTHE